MKNSAVLYYIPPALEVVLYRGPRLNFNMFRKDLKLFRGVDNSIEFIIKDVNRVTVVIDNKTLKCIITDPYNHELMLVKYLTLKNPESGLYQLDLCPGDIQKWNAGFYNFCITMTDVNGIEELFYTTMDQDVTGTFELIDKPFPAFVPSHLIESKDFVKTQYVNAAALVLQTNNTQHPVTADFVTSRFSGAGQKNLSSGLHTFSIFLHDFTGKFWVQGSLETNPLSEADWFDIPVDPISNDNHIDFHHSYGIHVFNFEGNYNWIRFKYQIFMLNYGAIERIWYKV